MNGLDSAIRDAGAAAYAAYGSSADANVRYLTRFRTTDPVVYLQKPGERGMIVVPQMEHERAVRESTAAVATRADAGYLEYIKAGEPRWRATAHMIADLAGGPILVPATFPLALARELESFRPVLLDAAGAVEGMRAVKTPEEIERIRSVQRVTEAAMERGIALIRTSVPGAASFTVTAGPSPPRRSVRRCTPTCSPTGAGGPIPSSPADPTPPSRTAPVSGRSGRTNLSSSTSTRRTTSPATTPT